MRLSRIVPALFVAAVSAFSAHPAEQRLFDDAIFGNARLFKPAVTPRNVIVLLSDADGFGREESRLALQFARRGDIVIGLNWPAGRHFSSAGRNMNCTELASHIENITARAERDLNISSYMTPVLAGAGLGKEAALALAAEARRHSIAGVIALHSRDMRPDAVPACIANLPSVAVAGAVTAAGAATLLREIPDGDDDDAVDKATQAFAQSAGPRGPAELADLPLFVVAPEKPPTRMAVVLTGDGGMGALNRNLAAALTQRGIGVVTIDSRRYFWNKRDPVEVAADMRRIIRHYRQAWPVERVALVGYSFGGDALPLVYNRLPASTKRIVAVVSLLSIAPVTDMRIELSDDDYPNTIPLLPEAARIDAPKVQCIYGREDRMAAMACPALATARPDFSIVARSGGHAFDGDSERLADIIVAPLLSAAPVYRHSGPSGMPSGRAGKR